MMWFKKRRKLTATVLSLVAALALGGALVQAIPTNLTGGVSPMATQTDGEHPWHNLILSDHGKVQSVLVGMYFTSGGNQQFKINVSQWCDMNPGNDYSSNKTFLVLQYGGTSQPITGNQACNGWLDSQTFTVPTSPNFRDSTMFGAQVRLRWVYDGDPNSNCGGSCGSTSIRNYLSNVGSGEGSRIRFRFNPLGNGSRVGLVDSSQSSISDTNNSIVQASGGFSSLYMPFGLSCSVTSPVQNGVISVYDADNGTATQGQPLYFYVGTLGPQGAVTPLSRAEYGGQGGGAATSLNDIWVSEQPNGTRNGVSQSLIDNSRGYPVFTPSNFNNVGGVTSVRVFRVQPQTKYVLMIRQQHAGQFTYVGLPGDAIFGSPDFACTGAKIVPKATVNGSSSNINAPLGTSLTFRNWATTSDTTDNVANDTFRERAVVTSGTIPGGNQGPNDYPIRPDGDKPAGQYQTTFTPTVAGTYCRETRISNFPVYVLTPQGTTAQVCAQVGGAPAGGTVTPDATLDASEYEVGGSATGRALYSSTFTMPTPPISQGFTTEEYRGLYLGYTSRMWYDDGSETYAAPDAQTDINQQSGQQVATPASNSALNTWPRSPLVLQPPNNPNFKICASMTISAAYYERRTRTVYWVPPVPQPQPPAPAPPVPPIPGYWTATAWSAWGRVNVPYSSTPATRCAPINRYPSLRVLNGDIKVGGAFKDGLTACTRTVSSLDNHSLIGHSHVVSGNVRGSKGQYGTLALGKIANFGSNDILAPQAGSAALAFANSGTLGNFYGGTTGSVTTSCFNETFTAYPVAPATSASSLNATDNANTTVNLNGGTLTINGGTLAGGTRRIIRVVGSSGTVVINGNINFGAVGSMYQMPQFILLVDGNIDIKVASNVTVLNGLFVTRGSFASCSDFNSAAPNIHLDSNSVCRNKLTVNGAVITGKSVQPYRTNAVDQTYIDPAEAFDLKGNILIADYARKQQTGNFMTIGQQELPPRF